jgi:hypothetical protein
MPPFVVCRRAHLTSPTLLISRLTKHDSQPYDERFDLKIDLRRHLALSVTSQPHKVRAPSAPSPHPQPHNPYAITNGILGDALTKNTAKQRLSGRQPCDERVRSITQLLRQPRAIIRLPRYLTTSQTTSQTTYFVTYTSAIERARKAKITAKFGEERALAALTLSG